MGDRDGVDEELQTFAYREVYLPTLHRQMRVLSSTQDPPCVPRSVDA
jgi:hypothetical protein